MMLQHMHVTEFYNGNKDYRSKEWNNLSKEEKDNYKTKYNLPDNTYIDTCKLCCFNETLDNGKTICLLRHSVGSDEINAFLCYEDEFWEVSKIYEDDEEEEDEIEEKEE